jgi:IclR family acetate operon transcriptional repressor
MVKSASRVLQILEAVGSSKMGMTHKELCTSLSIPKGSLSLLLADLVSNEFLSFNKTKRHYIVGPQILFLAGQYLQNLDLFQLGQPVVHDLMVTTGESSALVVRNGFEIIVVYGENCSKPIRRSIEIGARTPVYTQAGGKAILAHQSEREIEQYFSSVEFFPVTKYTITDPTVLLNELKEIRSRGISYNREEQFEGISSMGAPVFDLFGRPIAALVVAMPTSRFSNEIERMIEGELRHFSALFSSQMGYEGSSKFPKLKYVERDEIR